MPHRPKPPRLRVNLPVSSANQVAGQVRTATLANGSWTTATVFRQLDPLVNQLFYPVAATSGGETIHAGAAATGVLDGNRNPTRVDVALVDVAVGTPTVPPAEPEAPSVPPWAPPRNAALGVGFTGAVRLATGDVNRDGYADIVVGSDRGRVVRVYDGASVAAGVPALLGSFSTATRGPRTVAVGDVTGDGCADVIVGGDRGRVRLEVFGVGAANPRPLAATARFGRAEAADEFGGVYVG